MDHDEDRSLSLGTEVSVSVPPPSPLTGCYLLAVIGEPHTEEHKEIILQRLIKGLQSWDSNEHQVDLEKELMTLTAQAPEGEDARNGERLIQFASENLVTEILIHPQMNTLMQCMRNLLSSFTRHRHLIHAGYTAAGNGSWIVQDGTFSLADFTDAYQENEVQRVIRAYENSISIDIHCSTVGGGEWANLPGMSFVKYCKLRVNPKDILDSGSQAIKDFIGYLNPYIIPASLEQLLVSSDVVGNIRFSHPTLYVFPGGQGDAALFGINGFNMLVDGGFSRKACWWDFARHLDRLDAVMLTRVNNCSIAGMAAVLKRKAGASVYPHIGHFFCNLEERRVLSSPDGDKDSDPLLVSLLQEGSDMMADVRHINLKPQHCWRSPDPINLYHKVGHGTLDMYVLNPSKDSKHVRDFLKKWHGSEQKLFEGPSVSGPFNFPIPNIVSICALLVWRPANPDENVTRLMFPGSTPQHKIFEGLEKLKHLEFLQHPKCTGRQITTTPSPVPAAVHTTVKRSTTKTTKEKLSTNEKKDEKTEKESVIKTGKDRITSEKKSEKNIDSNKTEKSKDETDSMNYIDNKLINELIDGEDKKIESILREAITSRVETKLDSTSMESITKKQEFKKKDKLFTEKKIKRTEKTEDNKEATSKSETRKAEYEIKSKIDARKKIDTKVTSTTARTKLTQKTSQKVSEKKTVITTSDKKPILDKSPPATPKKSTEIKITKEPTPPASARLKTKVRKLSPSSTPAKSTKEANNRRVVESKYKQASPKRELSTKPTEKKEMKVKREPISRRPRPLGSPVKAVKLMKSPTKAAKSIRIDPKLKGLQRVNYEDLLKDAKKSDEENSKSIDDFKQDIDDKEEQEIVREIEAVFNRDSEADEKVEYVGRSDIEKITCLITDAKTETTADTEFEEEYLIIEKEEIDQYTEESARDQEPQDQEDELQKHAKDSKESEKKKDVTEMTSRVNEEELMSVDTKHAESKEHSLSVEEKQDLSSEKKTSDSKNGQAKTKSVLPETQDEKVSSQITVESGATTTAPTLPEDERLTLDDIKENNQVEEKYDNEETKEVIPPQTLENIPKARKVRDIVKTPDEVADLPLHEEVDYQTFEEKKTPLDENKVLPEERFEKPIEIKDDDVFKRIPDVGFVHEIKVPKNLPLSEPSALTDVQTIEDDVIVTTLQKPSHAEVVTVTPGSAPESPMYPENKEIKDMLVGKPLDTVKEYEGADYCYGFTEKLRETHITTVESPLKENANIVEEISCLPDKIPSIPEDVEKEMEEAKLFDGEKSPKSPKEVEKIVASVAEVLKSDKPLEELLAPKLGLVNLPADTIIISGPETTDYIKKNDLQTVRDLPTDLQRNLDVKDISPARSITPDEGSDGTEKTVLSEAKKQLEIKQEGNDEQSKAISTSVEIDQDFRPSDLPEDEMPSISNLEAESPKTSERKLSSTFETAKTLEKLEEKMAELRKKDEDKYDTESEIVIVSEDEIKDLDLIGKEVSQIMPYKVKKKDSMDEDNLTSKTSEEVTDQKTELVENVVTKPVNEIIVKDLLNIQSPKVETDVNNIVQVEMANIEVAKKISLEESGKEVCEDINVEDQEKDKDVVDHIIIETKLDSPLTDTAKVEQTENRQELTNISNEMETSQQGLEAKVIKISNQGSQETSKTGSLPLRDTVDTLKSSVQIENNEISVDHSESLKSASPTVKEFIDMHTERAEISKDILADTQDPKLIEVGEALDDTKETVLEVSVENITTASGNVETEKEELESTLTATTTKDKEYLTDGSDITTNIETSIRKDSIQVGSNVETPCVSKESSRSVSPAEDKVKRPLHDDTSILCESQKTSSAVSPKAEIKTISVKDNDDFKELPSGDEKHTNESMITEDSSKVEIIATTDSLQATTGATAICEEDLKDSNQSLSSATKEDHFNESTINESVSTKQSLESDKISQEGLVEKDSKVLSADFQHELPILFESKGALKSASQTKEASPIANIDESIAMTEQRNETASDDVSAKVEKDSLQVTSEDKATAQGSSRSVSPAIKEEIVDKSLKDKVTTTEQSTKSSRASSLTVVEGSVKEEIEMITKEESIRSEDGDAPLILEKKSSEPASPINKKIYIASTVEQHDTSLGSEVNALADKVAKIESLDVTSESGSKDFSPSLSSAIKEENIEKTSQENIPSTTNLQDLLVKEVSDTKPIEKSLEVKEYETSKVAKESQISASPVKDDSFTSEITESFIKAEHIYGHLINKVGIEGINADNRDATINLPDSNKSSRSTSPKEVLLVGHVEEIKEHTEKSISDLSPKMEQILTKNDDEVESKDIISKVETVIRKDSLQVASEDKTPADGSPNEIESTHEVESQDIIPKVETAIRKDSLQFASENKTPADGSPNEIESTHEVESQDIIPKVETVIRKNSLQVASEDKIPADGSPNEIESTHEVESQDIIPKMETVIRKDSMQFASEDKTPADGSPNEIESTYEVESQDIIPKVETVIRKNSLQVASEDKIPADGSPNKIESTHEVESQDIIPKMETVIRKDSMQFASEDKTPADGSPNEIESTHEVESKDIIPKVETVIRKDSLQVASEDKTPADGSSKDSSRSVSPTIKESQKSSMAGSPKKEDTIVKDLDEITVSTESLKIEGKADPSDQSEVRITDKSTISKVSSDKDSTSRIDTSHANEDIDIDLAKVSKDSSQAISPDIKKDILEKSLQDKLKSNIESPTFEETIVKEDNKVPARKESIKGDVKDEPASKEISKTASLITEDLVLPFSHISESADVKAGLDIASSEEGPEKETTPRNDSLHVASDVEDTESRGGGSKDSSRSISPATGKENIEKLSLDETITSIDKISQEFLVVKETKVLSADLQHELAIMSESEEASRSPSQTKEASHKVTTEEPIAMTGHPHETASSDISPKVETFIRKDSLKIATDSKTVADAGSKDSSRSVSPATKEESMKQPSQDKLVTTEQSQNASRTGSPKTEEIIRDEAIIKETVQNGIKDTLSLETDSKELNKFVSSVEDSLHSAILIDSPIKKNLHDDTLTTERLGEVSAEITVVDKVVTGTSLAQGSKDSSGSVSPTVHAKSVDKEVSEITALEENIKLDVEKILDSQIAESFKEHGDVTSSRKLSPEIDSARKESLQVSNDIKVAHHEFSKDSSRSVSPAIIEESDEKVKKPTSKEHTPKTSRSGSVTSEGFIADGASDNTATKEILQLNIQDVITEIETDKFSKLASPLKDASPSTQPDGSHDEVLTTDLATSATSQSIAITRKDSLQVSLVSDKSYNQESKDSSRSVSPGIQNDVIDEPLQEQPATPEQSQKPSRAESPAINEKVEHETSTEDVKALKSDTEDAPDKLSDTNDTELLSRMKATSLTTQIPESLEIKEHHDDTVNSSEGSKMEQSSSKDSLQVVTEVECAHVSESKDSSPSASPTTKEVNKEKSSEDKVLTTDFSQKSSRSSSLTTEDTIVKEVNGTRKESLRVSEVGTAIQDKVTTNESIIIEKYDKKRQDSIKMIHDAGDFLAREHKDSNQIVSPAYTEEILEKPHQDKLATPEQSQKLSQIASPTSEEAFTKGFSEISTRKEISTDKNESGVTDSKEPSKTKSPIKESSPILYDEELPPVKIHHDKDIFAKKDSLQTASGVELIGDGQSKESSRSISPPVKEEDVAISSVDETLKVESAATSKTGSPTTKESFCGDFSDTNVIKETVQSDIEDTQIIKTDYKEFSKSSSPVKETSPSANLAESSIKTEFHDDILLTEIDRTSQYIITKQEDSLQVTTDVDENFALSPSIQKDVIKESDIEKLETLDKAQKSSSVDSPNTKETFKEEFKMSAPKESLKSDTENVLDALIVQTAESEIEQDHNETADSEISTKIESTIRKDSVQAACDFDGKPKDSSRSVSPEIVEKIEEKSHQDEPTSKERSPKVSRGGSTISKQLIAKHVSDTTGIKESLEIHDEVLTTNEAISEIKTARNYSIQVTTDIDEPHSKESKGSFSPAISKDTNEEDKLISSQKTSRTVSPSNKEIASEEFSEITARKESLDTHAGNSLKEHIAETVCVQPKLDGTVSALKLESISRKDSLLIAIDADTTRDGKAKDALVSPDVVVEIKGKTLNDQPTTKKIIADKENDHIAETVCVQPKLDGTVSALKLESISRKDSLLIAIDADTTRDGKAKDALVSPDVVEEIKGKTLNDQPTTKKIIADKENDPSLIGSEETPKSPSLTKETVLHSQLAKTSIQIESSGEMITNELSTSEVPDTKTLVHKDSLDVDTDADNICTQESKDSSRSVSPAVQTETKKEPFQEKNATPVQSQKSSRAGSPTSKESDVKEVCKVTARKESLKSEADKAITTKSKDSSKPCSLDKEGSPIPQMTESVTTIEHHVETVSSSTKVETTITTDSIQDPTDISEATCDGTSKDSSRSVSPANLDVGKELSPEANRTDNEDTPIIETGLQESRKSPSPLKETSPSLKPKESVFEIELHGKVITEESSVVKISPDEKSSVRKESLQVATDAETSRAQESKESSRSVSPAVQTETKEEHFHDKNATPENSQITSRAGSPTSKESGIKEVNEMTACKESLGPEVQDDIAIITEDTSKSYSPGKENLSTITQMSESVTTSEPHIETVSSEVSTKVESTLRKDSIHVPTDVEVIGDGTSKGSSRSVSPANKDISKEHSQEASRTSSPTTKHLSQDTPIIETDSQESEKLPSPLKEISPSSKPELQDNVLTGELPVCKVSPADKTSVHKDSLQVVSDAEMSCAQESKDSSRSVSPAIQNDTKEEPSLDKNAFSEQSEKLSRPDSPKVIETDTAEVIKVTDKRGSLNAGIKDETATVTISKESSKSTSPTKMDMLISHIADSVTTIDHRGEIASGDISPKTELTARKDTMQSFTEVEATDSGVSKDPSYSVSPAYAEKDKEISSLSKETPSIRSEFQEGVLTIGSQVEPQITFARKDSLQANTDIVEFRGQLSKDSSKAIQKEAIDTNLSTSEKSQKSREADSSTTKETVKEITEITARKESFESDETTTFEKTSKPLSPSEEVTSIPDFTTSTTMKEDLDGIASRASDLEIEKTSVSPAIIEERENKSLQDKTATDDHLSTATKTDSTTTKDLVVVSDTSVTKKILQADAEEATITQSSAGESIKSASQDKKGSFSPKHAESPVKTESDGNVSINDLSTSKIISENDTSVRKSSLKVATDTTCDQESKDSSQKVSPHIQKEIIDESPMIPKKKESIIKDSDKITTCEQSLIAEYINITADLTKESGQSHIIIREDSPISDSIESNAVTDHHDGFDTSDVKVEIEETVRNDSLQLISTSDASCDGGLKDSSQTVSQSINETGSEKSPLGKPAEPEQFKKSSRAGSLITDEFMTEERGQLEVKVHETSATTSVLKDSSSLPLNTTSIISQYHDEVTSEESSMHKSVTESVAEMCEESKVSNKSAAQVREVSTISIIKDQDVDDDVSDTKTSGLLLADKEEVISMESPNEKSATTSERLDKEYESSISTSAVKHTDQSNKESYKQNVTEKLLSPVSIKTFDTSFDKGLTSPPLADDNDVICTKIDNLTISVIAEIKPTFVNDREKSPNTDESIEDSVTISTLQNIESGSKQLTTKEVIDTLVSEDAEKGFQSEDSVTTKESCQINIDSITKDETDAPNESNNDQNQPHHEIDDAGQTRDISPSESKKYSTETIEVPEKPLEDGLSKKTDSEIQLPKSDKQKLDFVSQSIDTVDHKSISVNVASSETKMTKEFQMSELDQSSEKNYISNIASSTQNNFVSNKSEFTDHIEKMTYSSYGESSHKYYTESSTKESKHSIVSAAEDSDIIKKEADSTFNVTCVSQEKNETTQISAEDMLETKVVETTTTKTTLDHGLVEPTAVAFESSKIDDKIPSNIKEGNKEASVSKEEALEGPSNTKVQFQAKTEQSLKTSGEHIKREALIIDDDLCDIAKPTQTESESPENLSQSSNFIQPGDKTIKSEAKPSNGHVPVEFDTRHVCKEDKIDDFCQQKNLQSLSHECTDSNRTIETSSYITKVSDMMKECGQQISECVSDNVQILSSLPSANTQSGHKKEDLISEEKKADIQTSSQVVEVEKKAANGHVQHEESEQNESISYISMKSDLDSYDSLTLQEHDITRDLKDEQLDTLALTSTISHKVYSEETDSMHKSFVSIFESTLKEDPETLASSSEDISKEISCEEKHSFECLEKESKKQGKSHDVFTSLAMTSEIDSSHRESICTRTAHTETGSPKDISLSMTTDSGIMSLQADNKVGPFEGADYTQTLKDNAMNLMESVSKAFTEDSVQQGIKTESVDSLVVRSEFERVSTPPTVPVSPLPKTPSSTQEVTDGIQSELTYDRSEGAEETITKVVHVGDDILTQKISTSTEKAAKPVKVATESDVSDLSSLMHSMGKMKTETDTVTKIIKEGVNVVTQTITTVTTKEIISREDGTPQNVKTTIETTTLSKGSDGTTSTTRDTQTLLSECSSSLKSTSQMDLYAKDIKLDKEYLDTSDEKSESLSSQISEKESSLRSDSSTTRMKNEQAIPLRSEFITTVDDDSDDNIEDTVIDTDVSKKITREGGLDIVETVITTTKKELLKLDDSKKILRTTTETNITKERPDGSKDTQKNVDVRTEEINSETKLHKEEADETLDDKLTQSRKSSTSQVLYTLESNSNLDSADTQKSENKFDRKLSLSSVKDINNEVKDKLAATDVPVEQMLEGFTKLDSQTVDVDTQEKTVLRDGVLITQMLTITTTKEILISDDESKKKLKTTIETVTESMLPNGTTEVVKDVKISIADYGIEIVGEKLEGYDCVGEPDEQTTSHIEEIIENNIQITRKTTVTTTRQEFENSINRTRKIKTIVRTVIEDEHPNGTVFTKKSEKTSIADVFLKTPQSESGELIISDAYTDLSEVVEDVSEDTDVKNETIQKENQTILRTVTTKTKRETLNSTNATVKRIRTTIETTTVDEYPNGATETTKDVKITVSETQTTSDSKLQSALAGLHSTGKIKTSVDKKHNVVVLDGEEATQTITTKITKEELVCTDTDEVAIKTVTETITETAKKDGSIEIARDLQTQITYLPHGATLDDLTEEHLDVIEKSPVLDQTSHELPLKQKIELPISKQRSPIGEAMSDTEVSTKHINENGVDIEQTITVVTTKELISPDKVKTTIETTTVNKGSDGVTKTLKATKTTFSELEEKYGTGESEKSFSKTDDLRSSSAASDDLAHGFGSPPSDISSRESKATHAWGTDGSGLYYSDEDGPGSPSSTKSQIAHSPRSNLSFELEPSKNLGMETSFYKDPMSTSVYAQLPEQLHHEEKTEKTITKLTHDFLTHEKLRAEENIQDVKVSDASFLKEADEHFDKAIEEHKKVSGSEVISNITAKYDLDLVQRTSHQETQLEESHIILQDIVSDAKKVTEIATSSKEETKTEKSKISSESTTIITSKDPIESWGKPLGLPSPIMPPTQSDGKSTPKKQNPMLNKNKLNQDKIKEARKSSESPSKRKPPAPVYLELTYVPHHGNSYYSAVEFFKRVRARYYVFSGTEPSKEIYNALLDAKKTWEDKDLEVTIIPTYDTDVLGYWVTENEDALEQYKIDLSPSASRCTINLQDHETSCAAYRLEF